jgi:hypothetical protein
VWPAGAAFRADDLFAECRRFRVVRIFRHVD